MSPTVHYCPDNDAKSIVKHFIFLHKFTVVCDPHKAFHYSTGRPCGNFESVRGITRKIWPQRYVDHWRDEFFPLWTFPIPGFARILLTQFQPRMIRKKGWVIGHGRLPTDTIYKFGMDDVKVLWDTRTKASCWYLQVYASIINLGLFEMFIWLRSL